jgi:hypothetical protein
LPLVAIESWLTTFRIEPEKHCRHDPLFWASISGMKAFDNPVMASDCHCGNSFSVHHVVVVNEENAEWLIPFPLIPRKLVFNHIPQVLSLCLWVAP